MKRKHIALLLAIFCLFGSLPVSAAAESVIYYNFDTITNVEEAFGTDADVALDSGFSGKAAAINNGETATVKGVDIRGRTTRISQMLKVEGNAWAEISLTSKENGSISLGLSGGSLYIINEGNWTLLTRYNKKSWFELVVRTDLGEGKVAVFVDGVQLGGEYETTIPDIQNISYSVGGNNGGNLLVDELVIKKNAEVLKIGSAERGTDKGLPVLKERGFVPYTPEQTGVEVSAMNADSTVSASEAVEGRGAENLTDGDPKTYWEAKLPEKPVDNGKSLMFWKENQSSSITLATYDFAPETKLVILEQDVLTTDVASEKGMPYFYSSTQKIAVHTVLTDNRLTARNLTMINEMQTDRWYKLKIVMHIDTQMIEFYVDGKKTREMPFREDAQDISKIQYHMNVGTTGKFYIDNVRITLGDENNKPIIEDDFESYAVGTKALDNMNIEQGGGIISVEEYKYVEEPKFPQHIIMDFKREGSLEQAEITFPEGRAYKFVAAISRDASYWSMCSDMTDKFYSGTVRFAFSPTRTKFLRITIMESAEKYSAAVSEVAAIWEKRNPIENLAFTAQVSTSSDSALTHDKRGINDNIVAEFGKIGEWRPNAEEKEPWVQYNWTGAHEIDQIVIHDSARLEDNILKGVLSFSDGTSIEVTDIPASGNTRIVDFPARTVDWVRFTLKEFEGAPAVSEIQVFGVGEKPELVEYIEPWKIVTLPDEYTSTWFVSADIDDDGEVEMLGCRCDVDDYGSGNHPVVSACAFELDGSLIWTWGKPGAGDDDPGGDPGFQIYDIDNDGTFEVLMTVDGYLVMLNARTGEEEKRYPLPVYESDPTRDATDAITIANISGNDYPSDIIIKTRYWSVWAFTKDWELIWYVDMPGGMKIGHRPFPVDIDNDGYDEVSVGYAMINPDGSYRYMLDPDEFESPLIYTNSHCDSTKMAEYFVVGDVDENSVINKNDATLLRKILDGEQEATKGQFRAADTDGDGELTESDYDLLGQKIRHEIKAFPNRGLPMEDVRICICFCGGFDAVMLDGNGKRIWAMEDGMHYETIIMAQMIEGSDEKQIVTNPMIPSQEGKDTGTMPIYILDMDGNIVSARYSFMQLRFPCVINWNGKQDWFYMGPEGLMYDIDMKIRARTLTPFRGLEPIMLWPQSRGDTAYNLDLNGDGRQDIVNRTAYNDGNGTKQYMLIYLNEKGKITADGLGSGYNVTFY